MDLYLTFLSIVFGFLSAAAWLRASVVKISREKEVEYRKRKAAKIGVKANLSGAVLDGWDMAGTFRAQATWNSAGAVLAALSICLQAIVQLWVMYNKVS